MELQLQNKIQHEIADKLWTAETLEEVEEIIKPYGVNGLIVRDMMLATELDEVVDCDEDTLDYLKKFTLNPY